MASSLTQIQIPRAVRAAADIILALAPTRRANFCARLSDLTSSRVTSSCSENPALCNPRASAVPRWPAPMIAMLDFLATRKHSKSPAAKVRRPGLWPDGRFRYIFFMPASQKKKRNKLAKVLSSKEGFKSPLFRVVTQQVREPGGYIARRDIVEHPGSVVILAVDKGKAGPRILLEHQYRHAARSSLWELPAGKIDRGESPLKAARRELLEETGFTARRWRQILEFFVSPGFLDETMTIFLAQDIKPGPAQPEYDELIESRFFSLRAAQR